MDLGLVIEMFLAITECTDASLLIYSLMAVLFEMGAMLYPSHLRYEM